MNKEAILERIISDANREAENIKTEALTKAELAIKSAEESSEKRTLLSKKESDEKGASIRERRAAQARLESAKIMLAEKRKVLDYIYEKALSELIELPEEDSVALVDRLLKNYAEEGDEIFFAKSFKYLEDVKILPVIYEKQLKISDENADIQGGMLLVGKKSDKDLSYESILLADRDDFQARIAAKLFKERR